MVTKIGFQLLTICAVFLLSGCTTTQVRIKPLTVEKQDIDTICIEENKAVVVTEFLPILQDAFSKKNIDTKIYRGQLPVNCKYQLYYTATYRWDFQTYLKDASIQIRHDGKIIASVEYKGPSGLNSYKRESSQTKLDPVFDELLKSFD